MVSERGSICGQRQEQREETNEKEGSGGRGRMKQGHHLNPQALSHYLILCRTNSLFRMVCYLGMLNTVQIVVIFLTSIFL
jgi:hypothetical protein